MLALGRDPDAANRQPLSTIPKPTAVMWPTPFLLLALPLAPPQDPEPGRPTHPGHGSPAAALGALATPAAPGGESDDLTAGHRRMIAALEDFARQADIDDIYVGTAEIADFEATLAGLEPGKQNKLRWDTLCKLGRARLRMGENDASVEAYTQAVALHPLIEGKVDAQGLLRARVELGMAWLRVAETRNCVARHTSESCLMPIEKGGRHVDEEGSRKAIEILSGVLAEDPNDYTARWLLNIACMTVGTYPDGVPKGQLVPPELFASDEDFPRFVDAAPELGLNSNTLAGGAILEDFDGDDVLDIVTTSMLPRGKMQYWKGHPDGTFTERTEEANFAGIVGGLNCVQTDYDNDGAIDILVLRGAWLFDKGQVPNSLLHNDGHGRFTDVTFAAGLAEVNYPTQTGAWADYDGDGDLDLYIGNESTPKISAPCQLFRNNGDGTFTDVAREAGVLNNRYAKGVVWGDYDGDRLPDIYVSNLELNRLYRNKGDGTFENVADELGVLVPDKSFPAWFWDFDNDGVLDIYVSSFLPKLEPYLKDLLGLPGKDEYACLYRGDGKGGFQNVAAELGLDEYTVTMGANFGDLDNDGFLDFYLGTGFPDYEALIPNKMYWNRGGKKFSDVTTAGGFGHLQKGHGVAFADLDRDGDQDVFEDMGGAFPGDGFGHALFRNPGFGNHWIEVKLVGVRSNRPGVGARIRCDITEKGVRRSVYRHVNSGGSFGANPFRQHVGLGQAAKIDVLEVYWPTSDRTQTFRDVPVDQRVQIREDKDEIVRLP